MLEISRPIIVEGKYDKIKLNSLVKANIITTDGFGVFSAKEKAKLIRRLAAEHGIIVTNTTPKSAGDTATCSSLEE